MTEWTRPTIEHLVPTKWGWMVSYPEFLELGRNTDIGAFTYIQAQAGVTIEDNVQIGSHCSIYSVSTINQKQGQVTLKEGCCIGSHCIIMPGVTIGKNAIIGAGCYIDKSVPDDTNRIPQQSFRA